MFRFAAGVCLLLIAGSALEAQSGFVRSGGQTIPGASVTVTQGTSTGSTVTDADGYFAFPLLGPGTWTVTIDMFGFVPLKKEVAFSKTGGPVNFELQLKESAMEQRLPRFADRGGAGNGGAGAQVPNESLGQETKNKGPNQTPTQALDAALNSENGGFNSGGQVASDDSNNSFVVSGSLSPGMAQGRMADSGPDMRFQMGVGSGDVTAQNAPERCAWGDKRRRFRRSRKWAAGQWRGRFRRTRWRARRRFWRWTRWVSGQRPNTRSSVR